LTCRQPADVAGELFHGWPALLHAQADAALVLVDLEHHHLDLVERYHLAFATFLLSIHLRDAPAFDAWPDLDERAVIGDTDLPNRRVFDGTRHAVLRVVTQLLEAQRDAVFLGIKLSTLAVSPGRPAPLRWVAHAPCHVGDVQQAVDAAEVDERAVLGDVLTTRARWRLRPRFKQLGALFAHRRLTTARRDSTTLLRFGCDT
jgi:hypothetical protein